MRLLSARLRCLSKAPSSGSSVLQNIRNSSRYSKPGSRPTASIPAEFPAFTDAAIDAGPEVTHSGRPLNTLDADAAKREYEAARAHHLGRMRFAGIGLLLSVAGLAATLYNLDLDDIEKAGKKNKVLLDAGPGSQEQFEGRDIHIIGAGEDKRIIAEGEEQTELVQTGSGSVPYFPRKMYLPSSNSAPGPIVGSAPNTSANPNNVQNNEEYTLVGLGIRTVSFLSIEVRHSVLSLRFTESNRDQTGLRDGHVRPNTGRLCHASPFHPLDQPRGIDTGTGREGTAQAASSGPVLKRRDLGAVAAGRRHQERLARCAIQEH